MRVPAVELPGQRSKRSLTSMKVLTMPMKKDLTNGEVRQIPRLVFNETMSRVDPDKCAELLAEWVKLYKKFVARSKALLVGATKGEPGRKK